MRRLFLALTDFMLFFPLVLNPICAASAAEPNLVGYWRFDESAGSSAGDSTGHGYNGTISGATWFNDQLRGWCLSFDGTNDYVSIADNPALNITGDITISAWVYFAGGGSSTQGIVTKTVGNGAINNPFDFRTEGQSLALVRADASGHELTYSTSPVSTQQWHHVLVRVENKIPDFFLDGILTGKTVPSFTKTPTGNTNPLLIGRRDDGLYFAGRIGDVRIHDRALTDEEVWLLYSQTPTLGKAAYPQPTDGQQGVSCHATLAWTPGRFAALHVVYLGTDFNDVNDANTTAPPGVYRGAEDSNHYDPCGLLRGTTYYWRVDEVNDVNVRKGDVWSFVTSAVWKYDISFPNDPFASEVIFESDPRWVKFTVKLDDPCTVYFQDSSLYAFHYHFAAEWLDPFIGMTAPEFFDVTLHDANQQAVLGAVILPPVTGNPPTPEFTEYGIQFIRYDPYTKEEISAMFAAVKNSVIADPCITAFYFPTYEQQQTAEANQAWLDSQGIPLGSIARWIEGNICYSAGWAMGELKYFPGNQIQAAYLSGDLSPDDILMTEGVPAEVPFVAGVISLSPSTPNSHVAILSRTYGIPFTYLADASSVEKAWQLVNRLTLVCVQEISGMCDVQLKDAIATFTPEEIEEIRALKTLMPLDISPIVPYGGYSSDANNLLPKDINHFGGKASNYGLLRTSIPNNSPRAVAFSFDLWNEFMGQSLTPSASTTIDPCGYVLFWADNQSAQGPRHVGFKLSEGGESLGLFDIDGTTLIDGFSFGDQTADVSYGRTPDGNDNWTFFYDGNITPGASNPGGSGGKEQGLFINEFMADNDNVVADEYGQYDDWFEIYNAGPSAVDLGGMYLTDDLNDPTNWMIPVGISGSTLREEITNRLADYTYPVSDLGALSADLAAIRNIITNPNITQFNPQLQAAIVAVLQDPNCGFDPNINIRFRSSTNVEDSDKFTGAGLYDSYSGCLADDLDGDESGPCRCDPNESNERGVFRAIRKVLASFYNDNAFLERLRHDVNETHVGMAILVHHSFPDEIELANGVATMEKKQSPPHWDIKLATQKGATPVTNPEQGAIPEEVSVYAELGGGMAMMLIRQSNLVILGETVMQWQTDYNDLTKLLVAAAQRFEEATGKTEYILDFEYKKVAPGGAALPAGGLDVDQIRQIPPLTAASSTCPSFHYNCSCGGGDILREHTYEDPSGVSIETSYCLHCPGLICPVYDLGYWCRTVIRGYTTRPIVLTHSASQSYSAGWHNWCETFYFTPSLEPGIDQCLLKQLRAKDIRVIFLGPMIECGTPYVETFGFGSGPYYLGDFEPDGDVDMMDFALFAQRWLDTCCGLCSGRDLDCDENVGYEDLDVFADNWLKH